MRQCLWNIALAAGVFAVTPARADLIPGSEFQVALWQGFGMTDEASGSVHCHVSARGFAGEQVTFSLGSDNRFILALTLADGSFQDSQVIDVSIWTNVEDAIAVPATATDQNTLLVVFTDIDWAVTYLQDSQILTVTGEEFQHSFSIASANQALDKAKACLEANPSPG